MGTVRWLLGVRRSAGPRAPRSWRGAPGVRIAAASGLWGQEAGSVQAPMCEREVVFQNGNLCLSQGLQFKRPTTIISERGSGAGRGSIGCSVSPPVGVAFFPFRLPVLLGLALGPFL